VSGPAFSDVDTESTWSTRIRWRQNGASDGQGEGATGRMICGRARLISVGCGRFWWTPMHGKFPGRPDHTPCRRAEDGFSAARPVALCQPSDRCGSGYMVSFIIAPRPAGRPRRAKPIRVCSTPDGGSSPAVVGCAWALLLEPDPVLVSGRLRPGEWNPCWNPGPGSIGPMMLLPDVLTLPGYLAWPVWRYFSHCSRMHWLGPQSWPPRWLYGVQRACPGFARWPPGGRAAMGWGWRATRNLIAAAGAWCGWRY